MKKRMIVRLLTAAVLAVPALVIAAQGMKAHSDKHIMLSSADLSWGAPPPVFAAGAQFVVLSGDPSEPGPYVVRLKMPAGYKIAPHWHPTDEQVTVVSGTFSMGMGEKFDAHMTRDLPPGGYALMPAEARHFAWTKDGATVQVHGMGPFALTYVNPADDPSRQHAAQ
jgi:hypothetical protein